VFGLNRPSPPNYLPGNNGNSASAPLLQAVKSLQPGDRNDQSMASMASMASMVRLAINQPFVSGMNIWLVINDVFFIWLLMVING
jgi:hypothetical protein